MSVIQRFEAVLDAAIKTQGIGTILDLGREYEKLEPEFECKELLDTYGPERPIPFYRGGTAEFQKLGRTIFFAHVPISTAFLESIVEIEALFTSAVEEIGFLSVMLDLIKGPAPIAQRMQPFVLDNHQLRFNNKKGRLIASQSEYELVTFNIPRCAERLKEILLNAYKQDTSKLHLRKYLADKLEEDLGL